MTEKLTHSDLDRIIRDAEVMRAQAIRLAVSRLLRALHLPLPRPALHRA